MLTPPRCGHCRCPPLQVAKEYASFAQSARVVDATAELSALQAEATSLMDK